MSAKFLRRLFIAWGTPVLIAAIVFGWVLSADNVIILSGPLGLEASITGGRLYINRDLDPASVSRRPGTGVHEYYSQYGWWFGGGLASSRNWIAVPLWFPLLIVLGVGGWAWRQEILANRRARVGLCKTCGYDRTGLALGSVCPECGGGEGVIWRRTDRHHHLGAGETEFAGQRRS